MGKLDYLKKDTVKNMITSLELYAQENGFILKGNIPDDVNKFDDLFDDGGEGRHDYFVIESYNYAKQFGNFDDFENGNGCEAHIHSCIESAMTLLRRKYGLNTAI